MVPSRLSATQFCCFLLFCSLLSRRRNTQDMLARWWFDHILGWNPKVSHQLASRAHRQPNSRAKDIKMCSFFSQHQQQHRQPHQKYKQINTMVCVCDVCVFTDGWQSNHPTKTNRVHENREPKEENEKIKKKRWKRSRGSHLLRRRLMCSRVLRYFCLNHHSIWRDERRRLTVYVWCVHIALLYHSRRSHPD